MENQWSYSPCGLNRLILMVCSGYHKSDKCKINGKIENIFLSTKSDNCVSTHFNGQVISVLAKCT